MLACAYKPTVKVEAVVPDNLISKAMPWNAKPDTVYLDTCQTIP